MATYPVQATWHDLSEGSERPSHEAQVLVWTGASYYKCTYENGLFLVAPGMWDCEAVAWMYFPQPPDFPATQLVKNVTVETKRPVHIDIRKVDEGVHVGYVRRVRAPKGDS